MGILITDDIKKVAQFYLDALISDLSRPCRLVYPPRMIVCNNCVQNSMTGRSANIYRTGGPAPFTGVCGLCGGSGRIAQEESEIIEMLITTNPQKFMKVDFPVNIPEGSVAIKTMYYNVPKLMKADYIILNIEEESVISYKYVRAGEVQFPSNIVKNRYAVCLLKRGG